MQTSYTPYPQNQAYGPGPAAPVDPIISRVRPRNLTGILDQAFRLYRRNFLTFLAIVAVVFVPIQIITQILTVISQSQSTGQLTPTSFSSDSGVLVTQGLFTRLILGLALVVVAAVGGFLQYLSQGALTAGIADSYLDRPVSFGRSYREMFKHIGPLLGVIGLQLLIGIAIFALPTLVVLLSIAGLGYTSSGGAGAVGTCLGLCLILPAVLLAIYVYTRLSLVAPAVIIENLGPVQALRRSWGLVLNNWWRTFGLQLILGIMSAVVSAGPAALVTALVLILSRSLEPTTLSIVSSAVTVLATAVFVPIQLTAITLYYFDLRVRKEGFDLESAMAQYYGYGQQGYPQAGYPQGQYPYGQAQAGYAETPAGTVAPPALGYEQPAYNYTSDYPQGTPTAAFGNPSDYPQDASETQSAGGTPTVAFGYNPSDPTQNSWPTPTPPPDEPAAPPESAPPGPEADTPAEVPPPEDPYPTPGWLQRPSDAITPGAEPAIGSQPPHDDAGEPPDTDNR
jgi:hypothetical protein